MAGDLSVRTVLGTYVAKFLAATIVVLALVPFTAPFSTFDAVEIVAEQVLHVNVPQTKAVQDLTDVLCLPATACALTPSISGARAPDLGTPARPIRSAIVAFGSGRAQTARRVTRVDESFSEGERCM